MLRVNYLRYLYMVALWALAAWYAYLGWRETLYGLGVFLVPLVLIGAALLSGLIVLVWRGWRKKWFLIFSWISIVALIAIILQHKIERYKPVFNIYIPENYEGMVYLLPAITSTTELYIDTNGIGYYNPGREVEVKIYHGTHESTNALNQYGSRTLIFPNADHSHYASIYITCFEVEKHGIYGSSPWNQPHATCLDEQQYLSLVKSGVVDDDCILKTYHPITP